MAKQEKKEEKTTYALYSVGGQRVVADTKTGKVKGRNSYIDLKSAKKLIKNKATKKKTNDKKDK